MLDGYMEDFMLLTREQSPDTLGGTVETWYDFITFRGALTQVAGTEVTIAELNALRTVSVLLHEFDVTLRQGDRVRREADSAVYRVAGNSDDMRTPMIATLQFAQVPVEKIVMESSLHGM